MNEAELLFSELLGCDRLALYLGPRYPDKGVLKTASTMLKRRLAGEPLAYIMGKADFLGLEFKLSPAVLVPRPETEILVETAIKLVSGIKYHVLGAQVLDLGTGSGCIAITLAKELPWVKIDAVDISQEALRIAGENALLHKVQINFMHADLFNTPGLTPLTYELIVGNPPYIPTCEISRLEPEVCQEPRLALDGGSDGLDFYRRIAKDAPQHLKKDGFLLLEIGYGQREAIEAIMGFSGKLEVTQVLKDYSNIDRVLIARRK